MVDFDEMKTWIRKCTERHSQRDEKDLSSLVNLRVIDCEDKGRRVITAPADAEFVALSYVWGSFGCDSKTKSEHQSHLPLTVEDAALATERLGYRYPWVDRYVCQPALIVSRS